MWWLPAPSTAVSESAQGETFAGDHVAADAQSDTQSNAPLSPVSAQEAPTTAKPFQTRRLVDTLTPLQRQLNLELLEIPGDNASEIEQLHRDVDTLETSLRHQARSHAAEQVSAKRLATELAKSQASLTLANEIAAETAVSQAKLAEHLSGEVESRESLLRQLENEYTSLQHHVSFYRDRANQHQADLGEIQAQQAMQDREIQALGTSVQTARRALENSGRQVERLLDDALAMRGTRTRLNDQIGVLDSETTRQQNELSVLRVDHSSLQERAVELEREVLLWQAETRRSNTAKSGLAGQCDRLQQVCRDLEDQLVDRDNQLADRDKQISEISKQASVAMLRSQRLAVEVRQKSRHRTFLARQLEKQRHHRQCETARLQRSSQQQAQQIELASQNVAVLKRQLDETKREITQLRSSHDEALAKLAVQNEIVQTRDETIKNLRGNAERLADIQQSHFESLTGRIQTLLAQLGDQKSLAEQNERRMTETLVDQTAQIRRLAKQCDLSTDEIIALTQVNEELQYQLSQLRAKLASGQATGRLLIEQYTAKVERRDQQIAHLLSERDLPVPSRSDRAA